MLFSRKVKPQIIAWSALITFVVTFVTWSFINIKAYAEAPVPKCVFTSTITEIMSTDYNKVIVRVASGETVKINSTYVKLFVGSEVCVRKELPYVS